MSVKERGAETKATHGDGERGELPHALIQTLTHGSGKDKANDLVVLDQGRGDVVSGSAAHDVIHGGGDARADQEGEDGLRILDVRELLGEGRDLGSDDFAGKAREKAGEPRSAPRSLTPSSLLQTILLGSNSLSGEGSMLDIRQGAHTTVLERLRTQPSLGPSSMSQLITSAASSSVEPRSGRPCKLRGRQRAHQIGGA